MNMAPDAGNGSRPLKSAGARGAYEGARSSAETRRASLLDSLSLKLSFCARHWGEEPP
jgi:hypothetical protein